MHIVIFDPALGSEETAERKLLFYHPPTTPLDEQVRAVGFCEAVTNFISTFTSDACESVHTQHGRQILLQPEPGLWMALTVVFPTPAPTARTSAGLAAATAEASAKEERDQEAEALPSSEEAVQDAALQALLQKVYALLRMTCGPLKRIAAERGVDGLRALLGEVMPLLMRLTLSALADDPSRPDVVDAIDGVRFLPVDRRLYLRVQYLLNLVRTRHACVHHVLLLHSDHLVWSSLTANATQLLHSYLVLLTGSAPAQPAKVDRLQLNSTALPDEALALGVALVQRQLRAFARPPPPAGNFVCGAADSMQDARSAVRVPCVHIEAQPGDPPDETPDVTTEQAHDVPVDIADVGGAHATASRAAVNTPSTTPTEHSKGASKREGGAETSGGTSVERHRLVVFQMGHATLACLVDERSPLWMAPAWYQELSALVVPELQPIASLLAEQHARVQALEEPYKFVYFNTHNHALKCTMRAAGSPVRGAACRLGLPAEVRQLLEQMHSDMTGSAGVREVAVHAGAYGWLVGRASASRGFYVHLDGRELAWSEVQREVQALCTAHFGSLFLES